MKLPSLCPQTDRNRHDLWRRRRSLLVLFLVNPLEQPAECDRIVDSRGECHDDTTQQDILRLQLGRFLRCALKRQPMREFAVVFGKVKSGYYLENIGILPRTFVRLQTSTFAVATSTQKLWQVTAPTTNSNNERKWSRTQL